MGDSSCVVAKRNGKAWSWEQLTRLHRLSDDDERCLELSRNQPVSRQRVEDAGGQVTLDLRSLSLRGNS